jgi:hypothetical protein
MPRYELPPDLSPEEEAAVLAALEEVLGPRRGQSSPWALAGRAEALRMGALQMRRESHHPWGLRGHLPFVRPGNPPLTGRGDAR